MLLSSLDAPDIATIPLTPEQYTVDLPKLTESELEQISKLQSLDSYQQEFMELHYKLSHLPIPTMITFGRKGQNQEEIFQTQALAPNLHVLHFWYGSSQTMAF